MDASDSLQRLVVREHGEGAQRKLGGVGFKALLLELWSHLEGATGVEEGLGQLQQVSGVEAD